MHSIFKCRKPQKTPTLKGRRAALSSRQGFAEVRAHEPPSVQAFLAMYCDEVLGLVDEGAPEDDEVWSGRWHFCPIWLLPAASQLPSGRYHGARPDTSLLLRHVCVANSLGLWSSKS